MQKTQRSYGILCVSFFMLQTFPVLCGVCPLWKVQNDLIPTKHLTQKTCKLQLKHHYLATVLAVANILDK